MTQYLSITKALSDSNRVRLLCALRGGELCVCQLIELLGLAPSTVSKHLSILNQANLVQNRKQGRWVHYRLPDAPDDSVAARLTAETFEALAHAPQILDDATRLTEIRSANLEALCLKIVHRN